MSNSKSSSILKNQLKYLLCDQYVDQPKMISPHVIDILLGLISIVHQNHQLSDLIVKMTQGRDLDLIELPSTEEAKIALGAFGIPNMNLSEIDAEVNPSNNINLINKFVSDKTQGLIPKFLERQPLGHVLISALYFKAAWKYQFDKAYAKYKFSGRGKTIEVPLMNLNKYSGNFKFGGITGNLMTSLILPYKGDQYVAVLSLPNPRVDLKNMIQSSEFENHLNLRGMIEYTDKNTVYLGVPKFKKEFMLGTEEMIDYFKSCGLNINRFMSLAKVDELIHKVVIDVNETGTEAAAVCGEISKGMVSFFDFKWVGNRPFNFAIVDRNNDSLLFSGIIDLTMQ